MSQTLETIDGMANHCGAPEPIDLGQPALGFEDLTRLCNHAALEMVTQSIVFFSAQTSRVVHANRAACHRLGYTQQQ